MKRPLWLDKEGRPITVEEFERLKADMSYSVIAQTEVRDFTISTVWLGLDHAVGPDAPPMIFESMVFRGRWSEAEARGQVPDMSGLECFRYSTEELARLGHAGLVDTFADPEVLH